jgi:hypothetical protein
VRTAGHIGHRHDGNTEARWREAAMQQRELPATKLDSVFDPRWESMCRIGERNLDPPILDTFTRALQPPSDFRRLRREP